MNQLRLSGIDRGDHCELLVFVDGDDVLVSLDAVGGDPDALLPELAVPAQPRRVQVGHCGCGDPSCGTVSVEVRAEDGMVVWDGWESTLGFEVPASMVFERGAYDAEIARADRDRGWQSPERSFALSVAARIDADARAALKWRGLEYTEVVPAGDGAIAVCFRAEVRDARWSVYALFALSEDEQTVLDWLVRRGPTSWPAVAWWGENEAAAFVQPPMAGRRWMMWTPSAAGATHWDPPVGFAR